MELQSNRGRSQKLPAGPPVVMYGISMYAHGVCVCVCVLVTVPCTVRL